MTAGEVLMDSGVHIGVDGISGGWIAVIWQPALMSIKPLVVSQLKDLIEAYPETTIAVDMPIGLSPTGTRACDVAARKFLGAPRASSVFPPPIPAALAAQTYPEAAQLSREHHPRRKAIPKQTFAIFAKIREVRATVTPELQDRVFEVHPEVCFQELAGHRLLDRKKEVAGYDARRTLLERAFGIAIPDRGDLRKWVAGNRLDNGILPGPAPDDVLDAMVAAWTAQRFATGRSHRFPVDTVERDDLGLRMEMVY